MAFIDAHRKRWNVAVICRVLEFSERTYYASKTRPASLRAEADKEHEKQIRRVWENNYRAYGARRIYKQLLRENYTIARCQVERLMAAMGIHGVQRGKRQFTTVQDRNASRPPDLVRRNFQAERPNELWLADLTYCSTWEGWLYVAFVLDVCTRMIVGWQLATHMRTDLVLDALDMAVWHRQSAIGDLVHHSDAGSQYTSIRYGERLADAGIAASIGTVADSYDNAMAEALNGTFKAELIHLHGPWRTRAQLEWAIVEWISWYNHSRLHSEIGDVPPAEFEAEWYRQHLPAVTAGTQ